MKTVEPYSVLAAGYDLVMAHVDYEEWATYVHELIQRYRQIGESPMDLLELGCGTAAFGFEFNKFGSYNYRGLDVSEAMVIIAAHKAELWNESLEVGVGDFLSFSERQSNDVVVLLYDGINYLLSLPEIEQTLANVFNSLRPGGLFLFDQSTPANSENNRDFFEDRGAHDDFAYYRRSEYDANSHLHRTHFEFTVGDQKYTEDHTQRAYVLGELRKLVDQSSFDVVACFEGFSTFDATDKSERIQWILRRPM